MLHWASAKFGHQRMRIETSRWASCPDNIPLSVHFRFRGALLFLGILLTTLPAPASALQDEGSDTDIVGKWRITSILDYAATSIGADQARPFIGKELIISARKIAFGNQVCADPTFLTERVETTIELRENARVSNDKLGLPNPVTVVELSCAYAYIKDRRRIVLAWNGIFFEAVRKTKRAVTTPSH